MELFEIDLHGQEQENNHIWTFQLSPRSPFSKAACCLLCKYLTGSIPNLCFINQQSITLHTTTTLPPSSLSKWSSTLFSLLFVPLLPLLLPSITSRSLLLSLSLPRLLRTLLISWNSSRWFTTRSAARWLRSALLLPPSARWCTRPSTRLSPRLSSRSRSASPPSKPSVVSRDASWLRFLVQLDYSSRLSLNLINVFFVICQWYCRWFTCMFVGTVVTSRSIPRFISSVLFEVFFSRCSFSHPSHSHLCIPGFVLECLRVWWHLWWCHWFRGSRTQL